MRFIIYIFVGPSYEWETATPPAQLLAMISAKNQGTWISRIFRPGVKVKVRGSRFWFSKATIGNMPMSGNSFSHLLAGDVIQSIAGSKVRARFRLPIFVFAFSAFWLAGAILGCVIGAIGVISEAIKQGSLSRVQDLVIFALLPIFGLAIFKFGRRLARSNEAEILAIACECLGEPKQTGDLVADTEQ